MRQDITVVGLGSAGNLRHGQEHRVAEEEHPRQGSGHDGITDSTRDKNSSTEHGSLPRSSSTQVDELSHSTT